jgi:hypothetical protein
MDLLFHYTSTQVALEKILPEGKLRFSPYSSTNDPLEFLKRPHVAIGNSEDVDKIMGELPGFENELEKAKIACFCHSIDVSDQFGWGISRSRMWSQYADRHFGVCLAFSRKKLLAAVSKNFTENESFFQREVTYSNKPKPLQKEMRILRAPWADPAERVRQEALEHFFCKREDYQDENEYRIVLYDSSYSRVAPEHIDYMDALEAIILGCRTSECYNDLFLDIAKQNSIDVLRINWQSSDSVLFDCVLPTPKKGQTNE